MSKTRGRIFAILIILIGAGLTYFNWWKLQHDGTYYMKAAAFGPVCVIGGFYLLLFPSMGGKPKTTKEKVAGLVVLLIGLAVGLVNWYLMDPGFFGR